MLDTLIETPDNPTPEDAVCGQFKTSDCKLLRYALFPAEAEHRGTIVMLHGRNESIEKYFETARELAARGFASATFDWRGQGGSERMLKNPARGYVDNFKSYVTDLDDFFRQVALPDCRGPFYVLAHSTGALVALLGHAKLVNRVKRMVLCAPFLGLADQPMSAGQVRFLANLFCLVGLGRIYMGSGPKPPELKPFARNRLTSDPARFQRNGAIVSECPLLGLGSPTARWIRAAARAIDRVHRQSHVDSLRIPALFIAAGADRVVSTSATELYASHARCGALVTIDGARHEILQEADFYREQFWAAFDAFIPGSQEPDPKPDGEKDEALSGSES